MVVTALKRAMNPIRTAVATPMKPCQNLQQWSTCVWVESKCIELRVQSLALLAQSIGE